jgi:hypothetical protein
MEINKNIMEFIAVDLQPFSVVENTGFKRLIQNLQPKYKIPSRFYFTQKMLPEIYGKIKVCQFVNGNSKKKIKG